MQAADGPASAGVGHRLAAARRERGLSLEDVSEQTRIRAGLIGRIEQDDFDACGGSVYARGHIRVIARTVGLDPAPLVEDFDRDHDITAAAAEPALAPVREFNPLAHGSSRRGGFPWPAAIIVSLAAICVIALIAFIAPGGSGGSGTVRPAASTATPTVPARAATSPPPAAPSTSPPSGVNLRISVQKDPSWLSVRDDTQHLLLEQLMQPGDVRTVTAAHGMTVRVGNAASVVLSCNGKDLGFHGGAGAVVTLDVGLGAAGSCEAGAPGTPGTPGGGPGGSGGGAVPAATANPAANG